MTAFRCSFPLLAIAAALLVGCGTKPSALEAFQEQFVLEVEPAGAVTPLVYLAADEDDGVPDLADQPAEDPQPTADEGRVTLTGVVGGILSPFGDEVKSFPWKEGEATFYLVDPTIVAEFREHAGEEGIDHDCPYCRREAQKHADTVVSVSFQTEKGELVAIDSRELFGLERGDTVTVRGQVQKVGSAILLIADGLYKAG